MRRSLLVALPALALLFASCQEAPKETVADDQATTEVAKPDMGQVRSEIQEIENVWATAQNAKDLDGLMALYADDASSMQNNAPTLVGKAAIREQQEKDFAAATPNSTVAFETQEVYSDGNNMVTEVGTTVVKDAAGKVTRTGKYMAIFEKRDGKYLCVRDIYNNDSK